MRARRGSSRYAADTWPAVAGSSLTPLGSVQRFIYPRLVLKVGIITRLTSGHLASYDNLLCKLRDLVAGPGYSLLAPNASSEASEAGGEEERQTGAAAPAAEGLGAGKAAEAVAEGASSGGKEGGEKAGDIDDSATKADDAPPPPQILAPLQCSIQALSTAIAASHPSPPSPSTPATSLYAATPSSTSAPPPSRPSEGLSQSLSALSEYLVTQTYASTSPAYRSYGLVASGSVPGSVGAEKKSLPEAISNFKIEVRAVKGSLLLPLHSTYADHTALYRCTSQPKELCYTGAEGGGGLVVRVLAMLF